jgi:hypothetical protein
MLAVTAIDSVKITILLRGRRELWADENSPVLLSRTAQSTSTRAHGSQVLHAALAP